MAIITLNGLIAGMQQPVDVNKLLTVATVAGRWWSPAYATGLPVAISAIATGVAGASLTTLVGQIPFNNPLSGNTYIGRFQASCGFAGTIMVYDRLWHNSGLVVTATSAQTVNSVVLPARDISGTTNGEGVFIGLEVSTVWAAATPTLTMNYTNSLGVSGRTTTTTAVTSAMGVGSFVPIPLTSGDTGVQSVQSFTLSTSAATGAYSLVAYRPIARLELREANVIGSVDGFSAGMVRLFDNTVPMFMLIPSGALAANISSQIIYTQG